MEGGREGGRYGLEVYYSKKVRSLGLRSVHRGRYPL